MDLTSAEHRILVYLRRQADNTGKVTGRSRLDIAKGARCGVASVTYGIRHLEAVGLIRAEHRVGRAVKNVYEVVVKS